MKTLFLLTAFICMGYAAYSQDTYKFRVGIKLAPEISYRIAGWEPGNDYSYTFGQLGGVVGIQVLLSHIETGVYYYQQQVIENHTKYDYDIKYSSQFLHIPILWRKELKHFYFTIGGSINAKLNIGRQIDNYGIYSVNFTGEHDDGAGVALGIHASSGYTFTISDKMSLFTEVRFGSLIHKFTPGSIGIGFGLNWKLL